MPSLLKMLRWHEICSYYRLLLLTVVYGFVHLKFQFFYHHHCFFLLTHFPEQNCSCAVGLMKMQLVPVLSLYLHLLMNHLPMMLLCCHLVFMSYHWMPKQFSNISTLTNITAFLVSICLDYIFLFFVAGWTYCESHIGFSLYA